MPVRSQEKSKNLPLSRVIWSFTPSLNTSKLNCSSSAVPDVCLEPSLTWDTIPALRSLPGQAWMCGLLSLGLSALICEMGLAVGALNMWQGTQVLIKYLTAVIKDCSCRSYY